MASGPASFAESISAYHTERWRSMHKHLKKAWHKADEESVHQARVEIKKINALYLFAECCEQGYDSHQELKPLRHIFKLLGKMRDYNRAMELCDKYKIDPIVFDKEAKEIKKIPAKIKALSEKHKADFHKIKRHNTQRLAHANTTLWRSYLHKRYEEIEQVIASYPPIGELHHIRRSVKYLLYDSHLSGGNAEDIIPARDAARLDQLQNDIGDWHDLKVLIDRLREIDYEHAFPKVYASVANDEAKLVSRIRRRN